MKKLIVVVTVVAVALIINVALYHEQKVPVLGYHSFYKDASEVVDGSDLENDIAEFEKQISYLAKHHYKSLTLDEFYEWKKGNINIPRKSVLITMDDGYLSNYMYAFPILKKYNMSAVVFFVGKNAESGVTEGNINDWMSLELIQKCKEEYPNIEFQSHSYDMHDKKVTDLSLEEIRVDINKMGEIKDFKYYAYPFGLYDNNIKDELKNNGYNLAFGFGPGKEYRKARRNDDDYVIPRLNISNNMSFAKFLLRLYMPF